MSIPNIEAGRVILGLTPHAAQSVELSTEITDMLIWFPLERGLYAYHYRYSNALSTLGSHSMRITHAKCQNF
jgi:hypothetical protein